MEKNREYMFLFFSSILFHFCIDLMIMMMRSKSNEKTDRSSYSPVYQKGNSK